MRKTKRNCISQNKKAFLFLAPSLIGVSVFVLAPFLNVVFRSFYQAVGGRFVGLRNFREVLNSQAFRLAVWNTFRFTAVCIPALLALSLLLALLVRAAKNGAGLYKTSILLPMAIPVASIVLLWKLVFHNKGILNQILLLFGAAGKDWMGGKSAFYVLAATYLWKNTGYDMVLWLAGLDGISGELYEAAEVDGAGVVQKFIYITMPGLRRTVLLAGILSVVNSFKVFREAYLVAGDYPDESIYMLQHLFNNWFVSMDIQKMSAASVLIEAVVLVPVILYILAGRRKKRGMEE
ncbi:ABC transporter permease subunit [Clostridium sp. MCC353]|uniref:carbohydrate ABC transporter permease n=1 Tax=Clostridium sp. MCC353 TaxID=2592646 RepID=UPI001C021995|nr:sugar ABC transporter permease [Clostridium sp. MCC353]MBT9778789.1 ABC transporter permease subunit [Clostridium sp. MCC353]